MTIEELKLQIKSQLPQLLREDEQFRAWLEQVIRQTAVTPESFDARFERILQEFAADRAEQKAWRQEQTRKWDEQEQKWKEQEQKWKEEGQRWKEWMLEDKRKWDEQGRKWEAQEQKWEEQNRRWEEQNRRWEEQNQRWEGQEQKWEEQKKINQQMFDELALSRKRHDQQISALGARWGVNSERSFREALKGILGTSFGVEVLNINEFDHDGIVFGRPDQVEIDVIIKNGLLILCELKSAISRSDVHIFERKVQYYQQRHNRQAQRKIIISPMVHPRAAELAQEFGIEIFGYAEDTTGL